MLAWAGTGGIIVLNVWVLFLTQYHYEKRGEELELGSKENAWAPPGMTGATSFQLALKAPRQLANSLCSLTWEAKGVACCSCLQRCVGFEEEWVGQNVPDFFSPSVPFCNWHPLRPHLLAAHFICFCPAPKSQSHYIPWVLLSGN